MNPLPVSSQLLGMMLGSVVGGYFSDRYYKEFNCTIARVSEYCFTKTIDKT